MISGDHAHLRKSSARRQRTFGFSPETSEMLTVLAHYHDANFTATMTRLVRDEFHRLRRAGLIETEGA
jgi:hypothetical protein